MRDRSRIVSRPAIATALGGAALLTTGLGLAVGEDVQQTFLVPVLIEAGVALFLFVALTLLERRIVTEVEERVTEAMTPRSEKRYGFESSIGGILSRSPVLDELAVERVTSSNAARLTERLQPFVAPMSDLIRELREELERPDLSAGQWWYHPDLDLPDGALTNDSAVLWTTTSRGEPPAWCLGLVAQLYRDGRVALAAYQALAVGGDAVIGYEWQDVWTSGDAFRADEYEEALGFAQAVCLEVADLCPQYLARLLEFASRPLGEERKDV